MRSQQDNESDFDLLTHAEMVKATHIWTGPKFIMWKFDVFHHKYLAKILFHSEKWSDEAYLRKKSEPSGKTTRRSFGWSGTPLWNLGVLFFKKRNDHHWLLRENKDKTPRNSRRKKEKYNTKLLWVMDDWWLLYSSM